MAKHVDTAEQQLDEASTEKGSSDQALTEEAATHENPAADEEEKKGVDRTSRWKRVRSKQRSDRGGSLLRGRLKPSLTSTLVAITILLGSLVGWFGYNAFQSHQEKTQRDNLVAAARQGAVNLTTINYTQVEADIQRILDSSTGAFHDDFKKRSDPFVNVVKRVQSKSEGTVTAAGLEAWSGNEAQVLVAVSVKTSTAAAPDQQPRSWRMRIKVEKSGDAAKIAEVQFVP
ncbi:hypothetical protein [Mycobacterium sp. E1747]|uniref:hypothetical protein n=1 Tax=Mycobacterium sp. E1747 TaxID=1834128 RepID=UPI0007FFDC22|nr:hypothetical protein [Mycobacterium sp. E1747]OBH08853.1 hypothetical protein A5695_25470 [Mycobacterium sp. E1747]